MDFTVSTNQKKEYRLRTVAVLGGVCFFIGRACFTEGLAPAGAALLVTLLMYNVTLLKKEQKAVIAGCIVITAQSVFNIFNESDSSISQLLISGSLTAMFCILFELLLENWKKSSVDAGSDQILVALSVVVMLMIIGIGVPWLLLPAAAVLAAFSGYLLGLAEGVLVSFASGMLLFLCGQAPSQILWLLLTAATAGFFKETGRSVAGTAILAIGVLSKGWHLIPAGILLILMPEFIMVHMEVWIRKNKMMVSKEADKNIRELSLLFSSLDNPRSRMAYEFKAILQLCQNRAVTKKTIRSQKIADAGYAGSSEQSGDSCDWSNLPNGMFAIALSDGMGKGKEAARESNLAVTSVIKLLKAGLEPDLVLKLLNSILMMDAEKETFSTMDLGIFDPKKREVYFYKIGAAPTLIKRENSIDVLEAAAMPMGVMETSGIRCISAIVHPGDQIIMMTDGVVDSCREDLELKWLKKALTRMKSKNPQTISDLIIREASENYGNREKDDMTVISMLVR